MNSLLIDDVEYGEMKSDRGAASFSVDDRSSTCGAHNRVFLLSSILILRSLVYFFKKVALI